MLSERLHSVAKKPPYVRCKSYFEKRTITVFAILNYRLIKENVIVLSHMKMSNKRMKERIIKIG